MKRIDEELGGIRNCAVLGHIRPDGDSVGAVLGMYHYIRDNCPEISVTAYLHPFTEDLRDTLPDAEKILGEARGDEEYDLCIALDTSTKDRLGDFEGVFDRAKRTVCIDHHFTNPGFADVNVIDAKASAASELLYELMDPAKVSPRTADCLFTGIVHDTGCFCHDNTTERTMIVAGGLIGHGARSGVLIRDTFTHKSYVQVRLLGAAMSSAALELDGKFIISMMTFDEMVSLGGRPMDMEPVIDDLRVTDGTVCAAFARQSENGEWRVSLRANGDFCVSDIAEEFGGGGHVKAAGCTMHGSEAEVRAALIEAVGRAIGKNAED